MPLLAVAEEESDEEDEEATEPHGSRAAASAASSEERIAEQGQAGSGPELGVSPSDRRQCREHRPTRIR